MEQDEYHQELPNKAESGGESQTFKRGNISVVDLKNYNTDGKETQYVQTNHEIVAVTERKKVTENRESQKGIYVRPQDRDRKISNRRKI